MWHHYLNDLSGPEYASQMNNSAREPQIDLTVAATDVVLWSRLNNKKAAKHLAAVASDIQHRCRLADADERRSFCHTLWLCSVVLQLGRSFFDLHKALVDWRTTFLQMVVQGWETPRPINNSSQGQLFCTQLPLGDGWAERCISPLDAGSGAASDWKGGVSHLAAGRSSVTRLRARTGKRGRRKIPLWPSFALTFRFLGFLSASATPCFTSLELDEVRVSSVHIIHKLQECIHCQGLLTPGNLRNRHSRSSLQPAGESVSKIRSYEWWQKAVKV